MDLTKIKSIDTFQQFLIDNNDKEGIYGDGKNIPIVDEIPVMHKFADQIYIRQMDMKQGQLVIGCPLLYYISTGLTKSNIRS